MSRVTRTLVLVLTGLAVALWVVPPARAEILHEQGSLRGFLGGSCPNCSYDNWISHISEGVARPGYNDYGPMTLDPQMNGFGNYRRIPDGAEGDSLLAYWYRIFTAFYQSDTSRVESLLVATQLDTLYQFAILSDSARVYYILREQLNPAYYDTQGTVADSSDDVRGSFNAGWGVYIVSPTAQRGNILIEVPHPEDDFIAPFVATDTYELFDGGGLMVTGAGREVLWNHDGDYDNSKSLSDPSRIERTVFQTAHRAFVDRHADNFVLQLHSFDSGSHLGLKSLVISAGPDDNWPNEPIMDPCAYDDMLSLTPLIAVPANTAGNHPAVPVSNYYCVFYRGGYHHRGTGPEIPTTWDLMGYGDNRQIAYSHIGHDRYRSSENIVHIEMDEMPDAISDSVGAYYQTDLPGVVTFANYQHALDYFRPAYQAMLLALQHQPMIARVGATPNSVNFGAVTLNDTTHAHVRFQNILQTETIHVNGVFTSDSAYSVVNPPEDFFMSPGQVCSLQVEFHPYAPITFYGAVTLSTDSGCSSIGLQGDGIAPVIEFSPNPVRFDTVEVGVTDTVSVIVRNVGYINLNIFGFASSGPNVGFLPPADSLIWARTEDTLRIHVTPEYFGAVICSVGVISDAFNGDTTWVTVRGTGTDWPMSVAGLTAHRSGNNMVLRWPAVTQSIHGLPIPANGYYVLAQSSLDDSLEMIGFTLLPTFIDSNAISNWPQRFYEVIAFYSYPMSGPPDLSHFFPGKIRIAGTPQFRE